MINKKNITIEEALGIDEEIYIRSIEGKCKTQNEIMQQFQKDLHMAYDNAIMSQVNEQMSLASSEYVRGIKTAMRLWERAVASSGITEG